MSYIFFVKLTHLLSHTFSLLFIFSVSKNCNSLVYLRQLYRECGFTGFFKGITASYFGITETIIYFVTYEFIKNKLRARIWREGDVPNDEMTNGGLCFMQSMLAGAVSRTFASLTAYPHGEFD